MYEIFDPVSGEKGYFCSISEKKIVDAVLIERLLSQTSCDDARGVADE